MSTEDRKDTSPETQESSRKPYSFRERDLVKIAAKILDRPTVGLTEDLFSLGLDDEGLHELITQAGELGMEIREEDVRRCRTVEGILRAELNICDWEDGFDPEKPVLVLIYGVARLKYFVPVMEELKKRFSVLAIEPIVEHYQYIFKEDHIGEVVDLYSDLIRYKLPAGIRVFGLIGYSFGGDLSYRIARRWQDDLGEHPFVYMIDTLERVYDGSKFEEYKQEVLSRLSDKDRLAATVFWNMGYYCLDVPKKLGDGKDMPTYDGPVRLLSATHIKEEAFLARVLPLKAVMWEDNPNVQAWEKLAPDIRIEYVDADHMEIMNAPEFHDKLFAFLDADLERYRHAVKTEPTKTEPIKTTKVPVKARPLIGVAVLTVIVILLQMLGGSIRFGSFSVSLVLFPIAAGAVLYGEGAGAWLGFVFGLVVLLSGEADEFLAANMPGTVFITLLKGSLAGFVSGLLYRKISGKSLIVAVVAAAASCPVVNSGVFLIMAPFFFLPALTAMSTAMGYESVASYLFFGLIINNFLLEFLLNLILSPILLLLLYLRMRKAAAERKDAGKVAGEGDGKGTGNGIGEGAVNGDGEETLPAGQWYISLPEKLDYLIVWIILMVSLLMTVTGYRAYSSKVDSVHFAKTQRAAQAASRMQGDYIASFRERILSDEFRRVHDEAVSAQDEQIIEDWMREQPGAWTGMSEVLSEEYVDMTSLYDEYSSLRTMCLDYIELFDVADVYLQYMENGVTYTLVDPNEDLFVLGEAEAAVEEFAGYGDNETVPPTVYQSTRGWVCTACEQIRSLPDEQVACLACVDTDMNTVMRERQEFMVKNLLYLLLELIVTQWVCMFLMKYMVTKPMRMLTKAARGFAAGKSGYRREDVISLPIHSHDEIGDLYQETRAMQERIVDYTENITRITAEKERVGTELRMAAEIQMSMLPDNSQAFREREEFDLHASMAPAKEVGGDFYDFFLTDDDHLCLVIADVSDKGVPAALFMMASKILINYRTRKGGTPDEILTSVNEQLCRSSNKSGMFVTVWIAILELSTGHLTCTNAGHEYPLIRGKDGYFRTFKDRHHLPAGAMETMKYTSYELILEPGDAVFVYTDGVPEAKNAQDELYGLERLEKALNADAGADPQTLLENVRRDVDRFVKGERQFDDLTMLCVEYKGRRTDGLMGSDPGSHSSGYDGKQ